MTGHIVRLSTAATTTATRRKERVDPGSLPEAAEHARHVAVVDRSVTANRGRFPGGRALGRLGRLVHGTQPDRSTTGRLVGTTRIRAVH